MKLRTENPQLAAYVTSKGGVLNAVVPTETEEGVTVIFEIDILGLGEAWNLRKDFYRGHVGVSLAEYNYQLGAITERMFTAIVNQETEARSVAKLAGCTQ